MVKKNRENLDDAVMKILNKSLSDTQNFNNMKKH